MTDASPPVRGARAELLELCERGVDWRVDPARVLEDPSTARPAAVLVLFGALDPAPARTDHPVVARDLDVLLQRRSATLGHHAGQISFPGGRLEASDAGPRKLAFVDDAPYHWIRATWEGMDLDARLPMTSATGVVER